MQRSSAVGVGMGVGVGCSKMMGKGEVEGGGRGGAADVGRKTRKPRKGHRKEKEVNAWKVRARSVPTCLSTNKVVLKKMLCIKPIVSKNGTKITFRN